MVLAAILSRSMLTQQQNVSDARDIAIYRSIVAVPRDAKRVLVPIIRRNILRERNLNAQTAVAHTLLQTEGVSKRKLPYLLARWSKNKGKRHEPPPNADVGFTSKPGLPEGQSSQHQHRFANTYAAAAKKKREKCVITSPPLQLLQHYEQGPRTVPLPISLRQHNKARQPANDSKAEPPNKILRAY